VDIRRAIPVDSRPRKSNRLRRKIMFAPKPMMEVQQHLHGVGIDRHLMRIDLRPQLVDERRQPRRVASSQCSR
jgi:hypothetical protein